MKIRTGLSILFRLCMLALFFLGLVWLIRVESALKVFSGIVLMLITVPLSYGVGAAISGHHTISIQSLREISRLALPLTGPIVLMFMYVSALEYYSSTGNILLFIPLLVFITPLFRVLIDAMAGTIPWEPVAISEAYSHNSVQMIARLIYAMSGLLLMILVIVAVVTLFLSLGDLIRQAVFSSELFTTPVLCTFKQFESENCTKGLLAWHVISIIMLLINWRYGRQILRKIDDLFIRL